MKTSCGVSHRGHDQGSQGEVREARAGHHMAHLQLPSTALNVHEKASQPFENHF